MSSVTLVSPPDILLNNELSVLLIHPKSNLKSEFQDFIAEVDTNMTVYLYEVPEELEDVDWLLTMVRSADFVVIDIDNCNSRIRDLASFIISRNNVFWLTNGGDSYYNKVNANRMYDLKLLQARIGEHLEKQ